MVYEERPHQTRIIEESMTYLVSGHTRGSIIMPCGSGKSLVSYWISQKLESKKIVIAVPNLNLNSQMLNTYMGQLQHKDHDYKILCVCSDEAIAKNIHEDVGVNVTTSCDDVKGFIKENYSFIIFITYQSGKVLTEAIKSENIIIDLGVMDEAHRTAGVGKRTFSHLLFDDNIKMNTRLFFTATPKFYEGEKDDIVGMNNEEVYGKEFAFLSNKECIEKGILCDYKLLGMVSKSSEVRRFIENNPLVIDREAGMMNSEELYLVASAIITVKSFMEDGVTKAVSYNSTRDRAKAFKELVELISQKIYNFKIDCYYMDGDDSGKIRRKTFDDFENSEVALLANSQVLTEGIDMPDLDGVVFSDARRSPISINQACGRSFRNPTQKVGDKTAKILIPLFIDDEENGDPISDAAYEMELLVSSLATSDDRIIDHVKEKEFLENNLPIIGNYDIEVDDGMIGDKKLADMLGLKFFGEAMDIDIKEISESLTTKISKKVLRCTWKSLKDATIYASNLGLKSSTEWIAFVRENKIPVDIPKNPNVYYKNSGWSGWSDFLGFTKIKFSYTKSVEFAKKSGIKTQNEWIEFMRNNTKPSYVPSRPDKVFSLTNDWEGWGVFLGKTNTKRKIGYDFISYNDYKILIKEKKFKSREEFYLWLKNNRKHNIPSDPPKYYGRREEWKGWGDFLGKTDNSCK